jgi:hypothetical protein
MVYMFRKWQSQQVLRVELLTPDIKGHTLDSCTGPSEGSVVLTKAYSLPVLEKQPRQPLSS